MTVTEPATPEPKPDGAQCKADRLSNRQREILALMAEGATNGEIAQQLCLAPATVNWHIREILSSLGARSRAHAVALALRQGTLKDANLEDSCQ